MAAAIEDGSITEGDPVHRAGERLGRFTLMRPLGRGAMGEVWAARDPELDREVAIKLLRLRAESLGDDPAARLRREAQAMARLDRPNVVQIFEPVPTATRSSAPWSWSRNGVTLRTWLEEPRTWRGIVQVALQAGRGLAAAHAAGLVHRDVKPDNVLDRGGRPAPWSPTSGWPSSAIRTPGGARWTARVRSARARSGPAERRGRRHGRDQRDRWR